MFDSIMKVAHYLAMIAEEPFTFDGVQFVPPGRLAVSPTFWRDYTCPPNCGGCCRAFSMDYWTWEYPAFLDTYPAVAEQFGAYSVAVNGCEFVYYSNRGVARSRFKSKLYCQFLDPVSGRCSIHDFSPFSCQFELNKLQFFPKRDLCFLGKKVFRNGWQFRRVDGGVGALCAMVPISAETVEVVKRRDIPLLRRLAEMADRFGIGHSGEKLIEYLEGVNGTDVCNSLVFLER